jgi:hypothetical protein
MTRPETIAGVPADFSSGLPSARDVPRPPQPVPLWSETFAFLFFDPKSEFGVWLWCGRFPYEPDQWRTLFSIFVPDGTRFVGKNYERGDESRGPGGSVSQILCAEPFRRWEWHYDGPCRETTVSELAAGPLVDGPQSGLRADLTFEARSAVWAMSEEEIADHDVGHSHLEQIGTAAGTIVIGGVEHPFDGVAWRDHSFGPRDMSSFAGHTLTAGYFEQTGIGFSLIKLLNSDGSATCGGQVIRDGVAEPVAGVDLELLSDRHEPMTPHRIELPVGDQVLTIEAEILHVSPLTMAPPNHGIQGVFDEPGAVVMWEGHSRFRAGDHVGYGYTERSLVVPE